MRNLKLTGWDEKCLRCGVNEPYNGSRYCRACLKLPKENKMKAMIRLISLAAMLAFIVSCAGITPQQQASADAIYRIALKRVLTANPKYVDPVIKIASKGQMILVTSSVLTKDGVATWISTQVADQFKLPNGQPDQDIADVTYLLLSAYLPNWSGSTASFLTATDRQTLIDLINMTISTAQSIQPPLAFYHRQELEKASEESARKADLELAQEEKTMLDKQKKDIEAFSKMVRSGLVPLSVR